MGTGSGMKIGRGSRRVGGGRRGRGRGRPGGGRAGGAWLGLGLARGLTVLSLLCLRGSSEGRRDLRRRREVRGRETS